MTRAIQVTALYDCDEHPATEDDVHSPVKESCRIAYKMTNFVKINNFGVRAAAKYIRKQIHEESYTPRTWRTHPLHICPPEPYDADNPFNETVLNWIFLISALNFNFWSEKEGVERYGVEWRERWESLKPCDQSVVHTGYWSLVAALDRALANEEIPIIDPKFYASEKLCPDFLIEHVFRPADQSMEEIPLLKQRIAIMREVGGILVKHFSGSFKVFMDEFHTRYHRQGTALQLVQMITSTFPSFRDEVTYRGCKVYIWKRAQILVAEIWAAFFPVPALGAGNISPHPIFPGQLGPQIQELSMFADYRVSQILHHLRILEYPPELVELLRSGIELPPGSREELSIRSASVVAVERVRDEIMRLVIKESYFSTEVDLCPRKQASMISSVLIDFYLWDLAKKLEYGEEKVEEIKTTEMLPIHRTRSIWY